MNFSTAFLSDATLLVEALSKRGSTHDAHLVGCIANDVFKAKKFLLPPPSDLNIKVNLAAMAHLRMPVNDPVCAFEYEVPNARDDSQLEVSTSKSTRRIALVYDATKDYGPVAMLKNAGRLPKDATGILVIGLYYVDRSGQWIPTLGAAHIDANVAADVPDMILDNIKMKASINVYPLLVEEIAAHYPQKPMSEIKSIIANDIMEELCTAVRACLLLNAKNLNVVQVVEEPKALNKKRISMKVPRPPFFSYYTLDLFLGQSRLIRKRMDINIVRKMFTDSRMRALHSVEGHFKNRKTGIFYWSTHLRGGSKKVNKE